MASPNTLYDEIATTTLVNRSRKLADNMSKNNAILYRLSEKGNMKMADGGQYIIQELEYAENGTYTRYSGYEILNISPSNVFTAAQYAWKQAAVAVTISGLEMLQNSGREQVINLLEARIKNAEKTFRNKMSLDLYSNGTADGSKQVGGLQYLVADDPTTGTVGGINRATSTNSFWRNVSFDATTDGGAAVTAANIATYMDQVWLQIVRGTDKPDLILSDNNYYRAYWESLVPQQRFSDAGLAERGFQTIKYQSADVVFDGGYGGNCPANHMYFLNTDYIFYRPHRDRNMVPLNPDRYSTNQDAMVKLIGWAGNMTMSNAFLQAVLKD